jgi:pyruvate/2-oxoglutarate/acetoin dehydrogenase E1 component
MSAITVANATNQALHAIFESDPRVHLLGEDLLDPYGGAFKISKGLSTRWPDRVITTPISEAAFVGICGGMALRGLRPVAEIMFGDFICIPFDQIVNQISKFRMMSNNRARCPVVVRTPMGGRRGYGPTHSQSLEKFFAGVPGLRVIAISPFHEIESFYREAICDSEDPVVLIENKVMYGRQSRPAKGGRMEDFAARVSTGPAPTLTFSLVDFERADVSVITYGGSAEIAMEVAWKLLMEEEIAVEVVVLGSLSPLPIEDICESAGRSRRVITAEEGARRLGIGAEIASQVSDRLWGSLLQPVKRVAALDYIIPNSKPLEDYALPSAHSLESAVMEMLRK